MRVMQEARPSQPQRPSFFQKVVWKIVLLFGHLIELAYYVFIIIDTTHLLQETQDRLLDVFSECFFFMCQSVPSQ